MSNQYKDFKELYLENLDPIFQEVNKIAGEKLYKNAVVGYWWAAFYQNSLALFELLFASPNYLNQIVMTLRLLMEIAADVNFISDYPENIPQLQRQYENVAKRFAVMTYAEVGQEAREFYLWEYKDGKQSKRPSKTEGRIRGAYDNEGVMLYYYLNSFSHFNHFGVMYSLNLRFGQGVANMIKERLHLVKFYPVAFTKVITSIGKLTDTSELKNYDGKEMLNIILRLNLQTRADEAKIINT